MNSEFKQIPDMVVIGIKNAKGKFRRAVELKGDLIYYSKLLGREVTVPSTFVSDGASVPQLFWNLYPPFGQYLEAAVVHDYFCVLGHQGESPIDYKTGALIFREAMVVIGVGRWKRNVMYQAVRWFGPKFCAHIPSPAP